MYNFDKKFENFSKIILSQAAEKRDEILADYEKTKRKVEDFYSHYKWLKEEIEKTNIDSNIFKSFIANSLIQKICELNNKDYKIYRKKLIADNVYDDLLTDTISRKIKKALVKISPKIYYKIKK